MQLVVLLPFALIRDLAKLSSTALVADAFILVGLIYIFGSEILIVADRGIAEVKMFNPRDFPLFIGSVFCIPPFISTRGLISGLRTAVFSFEGIGVVGLILFLHFAPTQPN
jgi:proton-coupled amino acid transporter